MKTENRQCFVFGGKRGLTGKEYGEEKLRLIDLKDCRGSMYCYKIDTDLWKVVQKDTFIVKQISLLSQSMNCSNIDFIGEWENGPVNDTRVCMKIKEAVKTVCCRDSGMFSCKLIFSSYEMSDSEVVALAKEIKEERN